MHNLGRLYLEFLVSIVIDYKRKKISRTSKKGPLDLLIIEDLIVQIFIGFKKKISSQLVGQLL